MNKLYTIVLTGLVSSSFLCSMHNTPPTGPRRSARIAAKNAPPSNPSPATPANTSLNASPPILMAVPAPSDYCRMYYDDFRFLHKIVLKAQDIHIRFIQGPNNTIVPHLCRCSHTPCSLEEGAEIAAYMYKKVGIATTQ